MARIPQSDLQQLKEQVPVQRLIESSGVVLKKGGKDFTGICPFHADETASLVVTPHKNLWHCFGCQIGGVACLTHKPAWSAHQAHGLAMRANPPQVGLPRRPPASFNLHTSRPSPAGAARP